MKTHPTTSSESALRMQPPSKLLLNESWVFKWWQLIKAAISSWVDDYAPSMGAALSYYTIFSLAPLLLIVISVAGLIFGDDAVRGEVFGQLQGLMGKQTAKDIQGILASFSQPSSGITGTIIGAVMLMIGATTVFGELQDALDRIWRAPARSNSGLWQLIKTRLLSFGMILGIAFLLIVSLVMGAAVSALGKWWGGFFGKWEILVQAVNAIIGFILTTAVFALIYKIMPRVKVGWQDVGVGAIVTALLFTIGQFFISVYIGKAGVANGFGAAGSVIVVLVWVYYSAQIFLVGAEFTWVYAHTFGSMKNRPIHNDKQAALDNKK
ncbi:MAG: YihY/virulence factor BrkB family protein [Pseudomonadota bacterium]